LVRIARIARASAEGRRAAKGRGAERDAVVIADDRDRILERLGVDPTAAERATFVEPPFGAMLPANSAVRPGSAAPFATVSVTFAPSR